MNLPRTATVLGIGVLLAGCGDGPPRPTADGTEFASLVDPFVGTANDGNTYPGAVAPWGMASPSPHTTYSTPVSYLEGEPIAPSGYLHGAPDILGFGLTHLSGVGCPDLGAPVLATAVGPLALPSTASPSAYTNERAWPGYYAVELTDQDVEVELTATTRAAVARIVFPAGESHLLIDSSHNLSWTSGEGHIAIVPDSTEVEGWSSTGHFCGRGNEQRVYFVARVRGRPQAMGTWFDGVTDTELTERTGDDVGAWLSFDSRRPHMVEVTVGLSYTSLENARSNLDLEVGFATFDEVHDATLASWDEQLSRVRVGGGTDAERRGLYTALFHSMLHPSVGSDLSGDHRNFAGGQSTDDDVRYTVFSLWDTHRTLHPLITLLHPAIQQGMVRSMVEMTLESGRAPRWELVGQEVQMMVGDPAAIVLADSWRRGIQQVDLDPIWPALTDGAADPAHRPGIDDYRALGFVPMERADDVWGPASTTLEYAVADSALVDLGEALGRTTTGLRPDAWANLFDPETGLLRPKNADGTWYEPFDPDATQGSNDLYDPSGGPGYVEGSAWQYAFAVPHDVAGLVAAHDGQFVDRLQALFDEGRFEMWNEPDIGYPWLFSHVPGEEWRTHVQVVAARERWFGPGPSGLPGNDDAGTLSAWYALALLGLYPEVGTTRYALAPPAFDRVEIELDPEFFAGDRLIVERRGSGSAIVAATWNGEAMGVGGIDHADITAGGTLVLELGEP